MNLEDIQIKSPFKGLIHLVFPNQYLLASTFMRFQEFYESPFDNLRGKYFSYEKVMDTYAEHNKNIMSYFDDWNGFNIPGDIFESARHTFYWGGYGIQNKKENQLIQIIYLAKQKYIKPGESHYIIGTWGEGECESHEMAHALLYLNPEYRIKVYSALLTLLSEEIYKFTKWLKENDYCPEVYLDEMNAYLIDAISSDDEQWSKMVDNPTTNKIAHELKDLFNIYLKLQQSL